MPEEYKISKQKGRTPACSGNMDASNTSGVHLIFNPAEQRKHSYGIWCHLSRILRHLGFAMLPISSSTVWSWRGSNCYSQAGEKGNLQRGFDFVTPNASRSQGVETKQTDLWSLLGIYTLLFNQTATPLDSGWLLKRTMGKGSGEPNQIYGECTQSLSHHLRNHIRFPCKYQPIMVSHGFNVV